MRQELIQVKIFFSAGFRPFFLLAAAWSAIAVPVWLAAYLHGYAPAAMPAMTWHAHEMIYGYAQAAVAGFVLTAIPNWTGRLPSRGARLAVLASSWMAARVALLFSAPLAALFDLSFAALLAAAVARELIAGRHARGLPMLVALVLLFAGNALVHLEALGVADTATLGLRLGIATLAALIALVGGRIVPSFTRNWLARRRPDVAEPAQGRPLDLAALGIAIVGLAWSTAFALFVLLYGPLLFRLRAFRAAPPPN